MGVGGSIRDEDFFSGGNFELAEKASFMNDSDLNSDVDELHRPHLPKEAPPPGSCPSHLRGQGGARSRRLQGGGVDLVKGIASTRRKVLAKATASSSSAVSAKAGSGVNEDTLRGLALEWGCDAAAARLKDDDWSRTVEALALRRTKTGHGNSNSNDTNIASTAQRTINNIIAGDVVSEGVRERSITGDPEEEGEEEGQLPPHLLLQQQQRGSGGVPPRLLDSSPSKDFLSIMSSITDVDMT